jgi:hypothetical protein
MQPPNAEDLMPRVKRKNHKTRLSEFLEQLPRDESISAREAARIAGCSESVLHSWMTESYPSEGVLHLAKLCRHFETNLDMALVGESVAAAFSEAVEFDVTTKILIVKKPSIES